MAGGKYNQNLADCVRKISSVVRNEELELHLTPQQQEILPETDTRGNYHPALYDACQGCPFYATAVIKGIDPSDQAPFLDTRHVCAHPDLLATWLYNEEPSSQRVS